MSTTYDRLARLCGRRRDAGVRLLVVLLAASMLGLVSPAPATAVPGEVLREGSDVVGNVHVSNGKLRVTFDNVGHCPAGLTCRVQVRWHYDKRWDAIGFRSPSPAWQTVPAGQNWHTICPHLGNGSYKARVDTRTVWYASTTQTVDHRGQYERVLLLDGSVGWRLIAKFLFNWSRSSGYSGGIFMQRTTATQDYSPAELAATSGNSWLSGISC